MHEFKRDSFGQVWFVSDDGAKKVSSTVEANLMLSILEKLKELVDKDKNKSTIGMRKVCGSLPEDW